MTAAEIIAKIEHSWNELASLAAGIDDEGLALHRAPDGWAVKDHLVHVAAWEQWLLALYEKRDKLAAMGAEGAARDVDSVNAAVYEKHRDDSAQDALDYFRDTHHQLMAMLRKQSTEDFQQPYKTFFDAGAESDEQPVLVAVEANTYEHYSDHVRWIREQIG